MPEFLLAQNKLNIHPKIPIIQLVAYDSECYFDHLYEDYDIELPPSFHSWKAKRKAQFLAGRIAIQSAFRNLKIQPESIRVDRYKAPIWPNNLSGSISHQSGLSVACLLQTDKAIGLDVQKLLNEEEGLSCESVVLTSEDKEYIHHKSAENLTKQQYISLIFSAKESFFKAAFKSVAHYFDFDAVSVHSLNIRKQQLILRCETSLSRGFKKGDKTVIQFCFQRLIQTDVVLCYCAV